MNDEMSRDMAWVVHTKAISNCSEVHSRGESCKSQASNSGRKLREGKSFKCPTMTQVVCVSIFRKEPFLHTIMFLEKEQGNGHLMSYNSQERSRVNRLETTRIGLLPPRAGTTLML